MFSLAKCNNRLSRFFDEWEPFSLISNFDVSSSRELGVDVQENEESIIIQADVPGTSKDEIDLKIEKGVLTIICSKKEESEQSQGNYRVRERRSGKLSRSFSLPEIDENATEASLNNGVLTIILKKPAVQKTQIKIK